MTDAPPNFHLSYEKLKKLAEELRVSSVVWCGVVWCGVVWCGVVWCGPHTTHSVCGYSPPPRTFVQRYSMHQITIRLSFYTHYFWCIFTIGSETI